MYIQSQEVAVWTREAEDNTRCKTDIGSGVELMRVTIRKKINKKLDTHNTCVGATGPA